MEPPTTPYENNSRIQVGQHHGTIVALIGETPITYEVHFDNDVVPAPTKKDPNRKIPNQRTILHTDIDSCWTDGMPVYPVEIVDAATVKMFSNMEYTGAPGHSHYYSSKKKKKPFIEIGMPVLWRDKYWVNAGGCHGLDNGSNKFLIYYVSVAPLVPIEQFTGTLHEPDCKCMCYKGHRVITPLGEMVFDSEDIALVPDTPVPSDDEDENEDDAPKSVKTNFQKRAKPTRKKAEPACVQLNLDDLL